MDVYCIAMLSWMFHRQFDIIAWITFACQLVWVTRCLMKASWLLLRLACDDGVCETSLSSPNEQHQLEWIRVWVEILLEFALLLAPQQTRNHTCACTSSVRAQTKAKEKFVINVE